eukprot:CAMPEP_0171709428 /NCGR_PEP_ID=MMETSP0991-20121206/15460_1 /TAXON_ID=483369 /ORGANISM="non described non described, Strain CCMP2098" /LENGTH=119 /DNA_ID=CAMNT_0012299509 /DNA_START=233 /DNA_END=590 /DNA_ORIENTATION=+
MNGTQIATRCTDLDCDESDEDNKESELWKQTRLEATKKPRPSVRYFAVVAGIQLRDEEHQEAKTQNDSNKEDEKPPAALSEDEKPPAALSEDEKPPAALSDEKPPAALSEDEKPPAALS